MNKITPEAVADFIADSIDAARAEEGRIGAHSEDCVLHIEVKPTGGDVEHFRAVVVPGEETPLVLEWPAELGLSWDDGGNLLTLDSSGIIRLNPRGLDEWEFTPEGALELAAQFAAMATLTARVDDLEGVAFGGTALPEADQGGVV